MDLLSDEVESPSSDELSVGKDEVYKIHKGKKVSFSKMHKKFFTDKKFRTIVNMNFLKYFTVFGAKTAVLIKTKKFSYTFIVIN